MPVCGHLSAGSQSLHAVPVGGTVPETAGQEQGCQRLCGQLPRHNTGEVIGHVIKWQRHYFLLEEFYKLIQDFKWVPVILSL